MSKRDIFMAAAISLILLLSACGEQTAPDETTPASARVISGGVVLPKGLLPDTRYAPPSPPARYFADTTLELKPGAGYGRIWPYVGGYAEQMWMQGELIGMCDVTGKIICDPVYNHASILEQDGKRLYMLTKNQRDENGKNVSEITLSKLDGSWAHEYEGVQYECGEREFAANRIYNWRREVSYEYLTVCENGKWGVIDYEGNEILPCVYNAPVCFSEGLAAAVSKDGKTYSFIDTKGAVLLGPYENPQQQYDEWDFTGYTLPLTHGMIFSEGWARFYSDGKYGVIDRSGAVIVPAQYDFITSFYKGMAEIIIKAEDKDKCGVIDPDGRVLLELGDTWIQNGGDGTILLDLPGGMTALDPLTGEKTPWTNPNSNDVFSSSGSDGVTIWWDGGKLSFPDAVGVAPLDNGNLALTNSGGKSWYIVDRSGKTIAGPFEGRVDRHYGGFILVYIGDSYGTNENNVELYNEKGNRILPESYAAVTPFDGRYLVRQRTAAGLIDEEGKWVVKVPLYDYIND